MTWLVVAPIALASGNDHVVNGRHAAAAAIYRNRRNRWAWTVRVAALAAGVPLLDLPPYVDRAGRAAIAPPHRAVTITRLIGKGQRRWDDDNLVIACKALRDAMQRPRQSRGRHVPGAAIVVDDGPAWSTWSYQQRAAEDGVARVEIEIRNVTEGGTP